MADDDGAGPGRADDDGAGPGRRDGDSAVLASDVFRDHEGWWVLLTVGFADEVVQRRIGPYLTEKNARVAAGIIRRGAERDVPPPTGF